MHCEPEWMVGRCRWDQRDDLRVYKDIIISPIRDVMQRLDDDVFDGNLIKIPCFGLSEKVWGSNPKIGKIEKLQPQNYALT